MERKVQRVEGVMGVRMRTPLSLHPPHYPYVPPSAVKAVALVQGCFVGKAEGFEQSS